MYSFKALGQIRAELMQQKEIQIVITLRHITLLLISTKATFKASASILLLVITASFSLLLFSHEASSDTIRNPYRQIKRQQQLEQETKIKELTWKNELLKELEAEINTENAIQEYYNRLN